MELDDIIDFVKSVASPSFETTDLPITEWPEENQVDNPFDKRVMGLKRKVFPNSQNRIILLVKLTDTNQVNSALRWTAQFKQNLFDPQSSDLYLFVFSDGNVFEENYRLDIEASETICRKYVYSPNETYQDFFHRSFLGPISTPQSQNSISDPLKKALFNTSLNNKWLTPELLDTWQKFLLSNLTGLELAETLLKDIQSSENNDQAK